MTVRSRVGGLVVSLAAVLVLAGCGTPAGSGSSATPTSTAGPSTRSSIPAYFVTAAHVSANLAHSLVVDARAAKDYAAGHIPGAINVSWELFAKVGAGKPGDKGWATLKPSSEIAFTLGMLGIDPKKQIVVYAAPGGWGEDGRILWMLRMAGLPNSMLLDGGYAAWTAAGYDTATQATTLAPADVSVPALDQSWRITTSKVAAGLGTLKIIDARTAKEYAGSTDLGEARGGHLPGAVNVPFESMFGADGKLKPIADLQALFKAADVTNTDDVVVYCTEGIRSAYMTVVLRGMGFSKARNYDGSFYEWAGDKSLQVVK